MADSEGKNAESSALSLGIKWIKHNQPHIRLLVSYAGRKEGNVGYIYQATNLYLLVFGILMGEKCIKLHYGITIIKANILLILLLKLYVKCMITLNRLGRNSLFMYRD